MQKLSTRHLELVRRVVCGQDLKSIAAETGMAYPSLVCITNSPLFKQAKEQMIKKVEDQMVDKLADPKQYLNRKSIDAAKKLAHLMDNSASENIQMASANSILDRGGAPKITKTEGEVNTNLQIDARVMKLLLVSKLEAGLIPDDQREHALEMVADLTSNPTTYEPLKHVPVYEPPADSNGEGEDE
jgi:hypothetical protein